jgi:hypothetical protein
VLLLFQGEPKPKDTKDTKNKKGGKKGEEKKPSRQPPGAGKQPRPQAPRPQAGEADEDEHAATVNVNTEVDMLDSLTGKRTPNQNLCSVLGIYCINIVDSMHSCIRTIKANLRDNLKWIIAVFLWLVYFFTLFHHFQVFPWQKTRSSSPFRSSLRTTPLLLTNSR